MINPILTFVFDRKHQATARKEAPVELRIAYNGKSKYISTGVRLLPKQWRNGTVTNREDMLEIQRSLDLMMKNVRKAINDMADTGELNTSEIKSRVKRMMADERSFMEYMEERTRVRTYGKSKDTIERYDRFLKWMRSWGQIIFFADVTDANIQHQ